MKTPFSLVAVVAAAGFLFVGCAGPQQKLGRGMSNLFEPVRGGEMHRSIEQAGVFGGADAAYTTGVVHGVAQTVGRTAIGAYEIVTFPIPPYHPVATRHFSPDPAYPDSYHPRIPEDSIFQHDNQIGFSGGDVLPWFPGSRFSVFEN